MDLHLGINYRSYILQYMNMSMWETLRSWFYSLFPIKRDVTRVSVVIWYISLQILGKQINNEYNITNDDLQMV